MGPKGIILHNMGQPMIRKLDDEDGGMKHVVCTVIINIELVLMRLALIQSISSGNLVKLELVCRTGAQDADRDAF